MNKKNINEKNLIIICDSFFPETTSAAVQLNDLCLALCEYKIKVTVICPSSQISSHYEIVKNKNISIIRIKSFRIKDRNKIYRLLIEIITPFKLIFFTIFILKLKNKFHGIIFYSPTIFHAPLVQILKIFNNCKSFLILRDLFPEWALDLGLLKKGIIYFFFKIVQRYQYHVSDYIGIQSESNYKFFSTWSKQKKNKLLLLNNWLRSEYDLIEPRKEYIQFLHEKKVFVYCGNMGVAQNFNPIFKAIECLKNKTDIYFLFIGRGSEKNKFQNLSLKLGIDNVQFIDSLPEPELLGILKYCNYGLVVLDKNHTTHNIPGKYLTYLRSKIPVLAIINKGNDLINEIKFEKTGFAIENSDPTVIKHFILELAQQNKESSMNMKKSCISLFLKKYKSDYAAQVILKRFFQNVTK